MDIPPPSRHRSRRLRKKLHIDEFQAMGFETNFTVKAERSFQQADQLFDAFISGAIEANALYCGGGGGRPHYRFFVEKGRYSATELDRERVRQWLAARDDVEAFAVGPLMDAWYLLEEEPVEQTTALIPDRLT